MSATIRRTHHPQREDPRPQHFHLIWPVSGLTIQAFDQIELS